jgi:hypothetical protein
MGLFLTSWSKSTIGLLSICAIAVALLGCGGERKVPPGATGAPTAKESLDDMVSMLNFLKSEGKPPPAYMGSLQALEPIYQGACLGIIRGEVVYIWGTTIDPAGANKVLAYEKAVETSSGYVLMQDGTVKTMQSSEFQAAPKATK